MRGKSAFKFADECLNRRLVGLLEERGIPFRIDERGFLLYLEEDEAVVENELISSIRGDVFPSWQVLSCPMSWSDRYKKYMVHHDIPFEEETSNEERGFLIPGRYRPHSWAI